MTDHLDNASQAFLDAHSKSLSQADSKILEGCVSLLQHLRSTPTAPARTEETFAPVRCALCTGPLVAVAHNRPEAEGLRFFAPCSCQKAESPDAEGSEGPGVLPPDCYPGPAEPCGHCGIAYNERERCPSCGQRRADTKRHPYFVRLAQAAFAYAFTGTLLEPNHSKLEEVKFIHRDGYHAGETAGRSSAARELTELRIDLAQQESLAHGYTSELAELADTLTQLRAALQCGPGDELTQVRAAKRYIDEQETELAELREKVKALEAWLTKHGKEVASELYSTANKLEDRHSGYDYGPRVAWLREAGVELDSVVKAHLRPGSGSDEGKATT